MAKKGLFGRLRDSVRKAVSRLLGFDYGKDASVPDVEPVSTPTPSVPPEPPKPVNPTSVVEPDSGYYRQPSKYFEDYKSQYEELIAEANRRWEAIESQGYQSMAISRARDEVGRDYFSLDFANDEQDVIEEVTRARVFMADKTSTLEGAELYTAEINSERFRGKFGGEYRKPEYGNKGFDPSVIDEEYAKEVFRSYRKLEEEKQGLIQEYGSENLIIAMYDAKVRGADPFLAGHHLIETWYKTKTDEWERRFDEAQRKYSESNSYTHGTAFDYIGGDIDDRDDDMYF